jgi:hypothetical protein
MEKIDVINFKKYYQNDDTNATMARVGHINATIEELNLKITIPKNPTIGSTLVWDGEKYVPGNILPVPSEISSVWLNGFAPVGCINEDISLPVGNFTYPSPLLMCVGKTLTVPQGTTLTIV